jgi:preprotein translocase subunit YajC
MENAQIIVQAISTVGFPAAMCIFTCYFLYKEQKDHAQEMAEIKDVIAKNNEILASLKQLIEDKLN